MYISLYISTGGHDPPPLPHVYIHGQLHRSVFESVNHYQLSLGAIQRITKMPINVFRQSLCLIRDALLVIFLNGYVTGMTEMTKEMESRT